MYRLSKSISVGAQAGVSMSWYSKTVVLVDEEEGAGASAPLRLHDGEDHGGPDTGGVGGDTGEGGTGDREFNRYSARVVGTYRLMKSLQLGSAVGISLVKRQFSDATWNLEATIIQATYTLP